MDPVIDKVNSSIDRIVNEFEARPIASALKGLVILYVLKTAIKWFRS